MTKVIAWLSLLIMLAACNTAVTNPETAVSPTDNFPMSTRTLPNEVNATGHRGARGLKPENTLPAFETALDLGVDTLELDLHYTADGVVVIWHDDKIDSDKCYLAPGTEIDAPDPEGLINWGDALMISQLTYEQLQAFRCDRNPEPDNFPQQSNAPTPLAGDDYRIISLAELFDFVEAYSQSTEKSEAQRANAAQVQFNVETKRRPDRPKVINDDFDGLNPGPFEQEVLRLVEEYDLQERVIIQSFDFRSLWAIRSVNEAIRLAALSRDGRTDLPGIAANGATIWSPRYSDLTPALISKAHKVGLQVIPWTVNDPEEMRDLIEMGVDGIITDYPDALLELEE